MADVRKRAQDLIDSATEQGRGINGRSYWGLIDRVQRLLDEIDRLRAEIHNTAQQGGGEIDQLTEELADERRKYGELEDKLASTQQKLDQRIDALREVSVENHRLRDGAVTAVSTDDLLAELRRRITFTP